MHKLLVVDDEAIIVDGLCEMFKEWESYQVDVYKAYSGAEALEWLARKRIDVVITDIRMPGIDGMQLLERIRLHWPGCKVVFLTGYDEFEYVYQAIRHEGVSYLLKTESYEKIAETVGGCLEQIRKSMIDEEWMQSAKSRLEKALPILQKEFLNELADGTCASVDQQQLDELSLPLDAAAPVHLIVGLASEEGHLTGGDRTGSVARTDYYAIHYLVEKYLSPYAAVAFAVHRNYMLWIVQEKRNSGDGAVAHFRGLLETAQAACRETLRLHVSVVIGGTAAAWPAVAERFASLKAKLHDVRETGMDAVLIEGKPGNGAFSDGASHHRASLHGGLLDGDRSDEASLHAEYPNEVPMNGELPYGDNAGGGHNGIIGASQHAKLQLNKLHALETLLEQGRKEAFLETFRSVKDALAHRANHAAVACEIFLSLSVLFLSYLNRNGMWDKLSEDKLDYERLTRFERHGSIEEAFGYFEQTAVRIFELRHVELEKRSAASVQRVRKHIREHPGGDLSLSSLADLVYFNPKYLSRLFKQETGLTLSDYIAEVKLGKVKEQLARNKMKVHEIAEYVGYYSAPCFTRFFKKATGMTPQEYRDAAWMAANEQVDKS